MTDFDNLVEIICDSGKVLKDIIKASSEKARKVTNETKGNIFDNNVSKDNYDWLKGNNLQKNTQKNSNFSYDIEDSEKAELQRNIEYEKAKAQELKKKLEQERTTMNLELKEENIMQAIVYSEILGKPRAKRRRRRW
ncbi:hypothetical protein Ccar_13180 [Clostridium carboxidivorans P7]|uniref:Uncharacterized protein n=1 Tax=Clostridium carboxidivorans P7 TaxID=536227 RepID=C6PTM1_9CLOT|nr:hypothetical protein [Clostridium carboxidivorans]AKN31763.1 hypothetical protein Ccar_13180 [Clostridium carboxidivorans P7]EET87451.1 hypothetical protein CcarbDRAFT_2138 [Clostridium carboxidivorans P7]EFG87409.1 hypothetical protein CLCAR_2940 [Clostridium carboxidivorans P7]